MTWETAFSIASMGTVLAWIALIFLPRGWPLLPLLNRLVVPTLLAVAYAVIVFVYFFSGDGGFDSLADVRTLFQRDPMLLAGWLHYLAFDLLVGGWIAERADAERISRVIQAPILFATFMFGPLGWLLFQAVSHGQRHVVSIKRGARV